MNLRKVTALLAAMTVMFFLTACVPSLTSDNPELQDTRYLATNIHSYLTGKDLHASYANYIYPPNGGVLIPVNTPVQVRNWRSGFALLADDGRMVYVSYRASNMGMSVAEYIEIITSIAPVNLNGFSAIDKKGIKQGKPFIGMSKEGIKVALGYPATHRTPNLADNTWIYWRDRFRTLAVDFDGQGLVVGIR